MSLFLFSLETGRVDFVLTLATLPKGSEIYQPNFTGDQGEKRYLVNHCVRFAAERWKPGGKVCVVKAAQPGHALRLIFMAVS